jgi:hypothetical protein
LTDSKEQESNAAAADEQQRSALINAVVATDRSLLGQAVPRPATIARNRDRSCQRVGVGSTMPDADWWSTQGRAATPSKPRPRERLWTLTKAGKRIDAELLFHAEHGVEIQFLYEGVMAYGRRWTLRAQAIQEASEKRAELEGEGWAP